MTDACVRPPLIVPSVLPADFARLGDEVAELCQAGVDRIQWDVMDGVFVPNLTFGPDTIAAARPHSTVGFEAHLMVVEPDKLLEQYVDAIASVEPKVARLRRMIDDSGLPIELEVDGGITDRTIRGAAAAGADVFISGSWMFAHPEGKAAAVTRLRTLAEDTAREREAV